MSFPAKNIFILTFHSKYTYYAKQIISNRIINVFTLQCYGMQ